MYILNDRLINKYKIASYINTIVLKKWYKQLFNDRTYQKYIWVFIYKLTTYFTFWYLIIIIKYLVEYIIKYLMSV